MIRITNQGKSIHFLPDGTKIVPGMEHTERTPNLKAGRPTDDDKVQHAEAMRLHRISAAQAVRWGERIDGVMVHTSDIPAAAAA